MDKSGESKVRHGVTLEYLFQKWLISLKTDRKTVQNTTQKGIRTILNPYLLRRFKTNERALRYKRLHHSVFTAIIQAGNVFRRVNWYAQVYSTYFGWSRAHPMKRKGDTHET